MNELKKKFENAQKKLTDYIDNLNDEILIDLYLEYTTQLKNVMEQINKKKIRAGLGKLYNKY